MNAIIESKSTEQNKTRTSKMDELLINQTTIQEPAQEPEPVNQQAGSVGAIESPKTLDEYAKAILEAHQVCEAASKLSKKAGHESCLAAHKAGTYLIQVKNLPEVGHGKWERWCKENVTEISKKTVERYMAVAKTTELSELDEYRNLWHLMVNKGIVTPNRVDRPPETKDGETVNHIEAMAPEIALGEIQNGFVNLQKKYDSIVKSNPGLERHLLSIDMTMTLRELFQRWQVPLGDAYNY